MMSDILDEIVGSFPDFPDCHDQFTELVREIYRTRERFAHMDRVLRECARSNDPIYRTAAALWAAMAGGPDNAPDQARLQPSPEAGCSQGECIHTKPSWDDDPVLGPLIREAYYDPANNPI